MEPPKGHFTKFHFHIHWNQKLLRETEGFETRSEATKRALELAKDGEQFTIAGCAGQVCQRGA
jgi:hypothetical protein